MYVYVHVREYRYVIQLYDKNGEKYVECSENFTCTLDVFTNVVSKCDFSVRTARSFPSFETKCLNGYLVNFDFT